MAATDPAETLTADEALRLADFARACKAAARVVALYPPTHPAIQSSLGRVAETAERLRADRPAVLTVLPDAVLLDHRVAVRPDSSLAELASLLHAHLIGELRITGALAPAAWHTFLTLLARPAEEVRADGGIERAWMAGGGGAIEIRQIDYSEVLREREGGHESGWDRIIANYLQGELSDLDDEAMSALFDIAADAGRFDDFTEQLVAKAAESSDAASKDVVPRVLQALANFVARQHPEHLDRILNRIAGVLPRLTPDLVMTLVTTGVRTIDGQAGIDLPGEVRSRVSDSTIAEFVAQSVSRDHGATGRLAQAFQALVPGEQRTHLLELAHREAEHLAIGRQPEFPELWKSAAEMMTTYSDSPFVSNDYGRELATARAHAIDVERVSDDPPERVRAWLATLSEGAIRQLDHQVLLDLLRIERRAEPYQSMVDSAIGQIDQYVLTGQIGLAQQMLDALVAAAESGQQPFAAIATAALERLRAGDLMRHVVLHIRQVDDEELKATAAFCRALGPSVIGSLAEALASEQGVAIKRLRDVLLSFGAAGRAYADELRTSPNPAVRRTAIELLRAFGGADALPDLAALLDDTEVAVQREALRAIVHIGTVEAYAVLQSALTTGNSRTRDAIMQVLVSTRDERAAPLFIYILEHGGHGGSLETVWLAAIEALGKIGGDQDSVKALSRVLYRGEWWAPFRTGRLRSAAALALRTSGSPDAQRALEEAASDGSRGVRRAARAALNAPAPRLPQRRAT
jgi:hypothetical protein